MEWLIILALAAWVWRQARRIDALQRRLEALELRAPAPAASDDGDVLVLDTPVPVASNDEPAAEPAPANGDAEFSPDQAALSFPEQAMQRQSEPPSETLLLTDVAPPLDDAAPARRKLEQWLAENGLAWLGGGAFALGGAMLVAIAVQQSWFDPPMRLGSALALGAALIGAGEWLRRKPDPHALAAALLAGAGVAIFYAAAWAAHVLYGFLDPPAALVALGLCALLLLALSFRHGQALGVLAILAAFLAPALTAAGDWPSLAKTLYLGAVAAAAFGVAALRRWSWAGVAALVGLYLWFAAAIGSENVRRALALACFASLGGVALAFRKPLQETAPGPLPWRRAYALAPAVAIAISSVALIWTWLAVAAAPEGIVSGPAWVGAMFVALAAAAARARVAPAAVVAVAIGALVIGFVVYLATRVHPLEPEFYPFILFAAAIIPPSAIGARAHRRDRTMIAVAGGVGAALLTALAAFSAPAWSGPAGYAPLLIGASALLGVAWLTARNVLNPNHNSAVDAWALSGAALALLAVESLFGADARVAAHAALALVLALAYAARLWRGLAWGALAAALLCLAHAFSADLAGAALSDAGAIGRALVLIGIAAGLLLGGAMVNARGAEPSNTGESLSAAAIVLALLGVYLALRWFAVGGAGAPFDRFTEAGLQAIALLAAGHVTLARAGSKHGQIGAARGHVLMALGFVHALLTGAIALNPWWGGAPAALAGPFAFNALALAYAAPAALLMAAAHRLYGRQRLAARIYAGAGASLALIWAVLEIRHAFHGVDMSGARVGVLEGASYGLLFLLGAALTALIARWRQGELGADLRLVRQGAAWLGLVVGGLLLLGAQQQWWSGADQASGGALTLSLLAAMALSMALGRGLSQSDKTDPTRFAAAAAATLFAWIAGHTAIRWALGAGLENVLHAVWPLTLVLAGSALTERAPGRETIRPYVFDLQAIWASAAWPAAAMAALGLWAAFNPWWGENRADAPAWPASAAIIGLCAIAAWMSLRATRIPHLRQLQWFAPAARAAAVAHGLAGLSLAVRASFHGGAIPAGGAEGLELWTYSAVLALYGAGVLALGARRNDAVLRWCGLAILFAAAAKVFALDTARLSGVIRAASLLGLAAVATLTALGMRRFRMRTP